MPFLKERRRLKAIKESIRRRKSYPSSLGTKKGNWRCQRTKLINRFRTSRLK
jgi:hypothetical protein